MNQNGYGQFALPQHANPQMMKQLFDKQHMINMSSKTNSKFELEQSCFASPIQTTKKLNHELSQKQFCNPTPFDM